jgi:hypothetical protein
MVWAGALASTALLAAVTAAARPRMRRRSSVALCMSWMARRSGRAAGTSVRRRRVRSWMSRPRGSWWPRVPTAGQPQAASGSGGAGLIWPVLWRHRPADRGGFDAFGPCTERCGCFAGCPRPGDMVIMRSGSQFLAEGADVLGVLVPQLGRGLQRFPAGVYRPAVSCCGIPFPDGGRC